MQDMFFNFLVRMGLPLAALFFIIFAGIGWLRRRKNDRTFAQVLLTALLWGFCWGMFIAVLAAAWITWWVTAHMPAAN